MIEIKDLVKSFDGFRALDGLTLTVPTGAVYGLVGPNGSGKSTLLRHVTGIYRQDSGEVLIDGQGVYENEAVKGKISYIPDDIFYFVQATVRDMKSFYAGVYPGFDTERYDKLREVFGLNENMPIRRMSKGMQKQAAFWLAMCTHPEIMVLDEPVDGLDPVMRRQIWSLIMSDAAEHGTTVLVSSHNLRELEDVCDHVGIVNRGKLLLERSLSELQESIVKVQLVLPDDRPLPKDLELVHESISGRLRTLIIRCDPRQTLARLQEAEPVYMDTLPLSLEEIFIYELGGEDYAVKEILL